MFECGSASSATQSCASCASCTSCSGAARQQAMGKPQDKAMEGQLSRLLHQWQLDLERSTTLPRWRRLVINIRSAQWLLPAYSIFLARSVVDAALNATLSGRQTPLLHIASLYAAMWSVVFFASSSTECSQALASIVKVAEYVEWRGDAATKAMLARAAKVLRRVARFHSGAACLHLGFGTFTIVSSQKRSTVTAWFRSHGARWAYTSNDVLLAEEMAVLVVAVVAYYAMLALPYILFGSCGVLYRALAQVGGGARGEALLREVAEQHALLQGGAARMRLAYRTPLLHVVGAAFLLPLVVTVELVVTMRTATPAKIFNAVFRLVANLFVPLCFTGQFLENASGMLVGRLYEGPWPEEDVKSRRIRQQLMHAASGRAGIVILGLGRLNAESCLAMLRQWFSAINVLTNVQSN